MEVMRDTKHKSYADRSRIPRDLCHMASACQPRQPWQLPYRDVTNTLRNTNHLAALLAVLVDIYFASSLLYIVHQSRVPKRITNSLYKQTGRSEQYFLQTTRQSIMLTKATTVLTILTTATGLVTATPPACLLAAVKCVLLRNTFQPTLHSPCAVPSPILLTSKPSVERIQVRSHGRSRACAGPALLRS